MAKQQDKRNITVHYGSHQKNQEKRIRAEIKAQDKKARKAAIDAKLAQNAYARTLKRVKELRKQVKGATYENPIVLE